MGWKLVLFSFLGFSSALVDSFPFPDGNRDRAYHLHNQLRGSTQFQYPNINPAWPRIQGISQSTQSPVIVWNHHNFNNVEGQRINENNYARPIDAYGYGKQVSNYDNVTPEATLQNRYISQWHNGILPQHSTTVPQITSNGLSEGWWNGQSLQQPQQNQFYGRPYGPNSFVQSFAKPYTNQDNYGQGYSNYQSAGLVKPKPVDHSNGYIKGWLPQNQFNVIPTASPVEYVPWPVPDNEKTKPIDINVPNEYNIPAANNKQSEDLGIIPPEPVQPDNQAPQQPVITQTATPKHYIIVHMNGTYEHVDNLDHIEVDEFQIAHIKSKEPPNHVLAIIEVEDTNETDNQSSLETPYDTGITKIRRDTDWNTNNNDNPGKPQRFQHPFTQTTTEDTTYDMKYFKPEYIMPIQYTTETTIDSITNPPPLSTTSSGNINDKNNFVMQSTTENTIVGKTDSATDSTGITTISPYILMDSVTPSTNVRIMDSTTGSTDIDSDTENTTSKCATDSNTASTTVGFTDSTIDSSTRNTTSDAFDTSTNTSEYFTADTNNKTQEYLFTTQTTALPQRTQSFKNYYDYEDIDYTENTKHNTLNTESYLSQQTSRTDKDIQENHFHGYDTTQSSNLPKRTVNKRDRECDKPAYNNNGPEQTSNDNDDTTQTGDSIQAKSASSVFCETKRNSENEINSRYENSQIRETNKRRDDLQIDVSELKTIVKRPIVWFRPDESFWEKVTTGEQAFDAVSIYDVHCVPKLVERLTTIHHHANGTETVDYTETIWDSPDGVNPREVRSKRVFREPES